jgi:hypothetical protein
MGKARAGGRHTIKQLNWLVRRDPPVPLFIEAIRKIDKP